MTDRQDDPPDPNLDPARSPGLHGPEDIDGLEVSRADVELGQATPEEFTATDTVPVADASADDLLAHLASGDPPERRRAALALGERADVPESIVSQLATVARTDDDADVRQFAVESLAKLGGDQAERTATTLSADPNPWVRAEAYVALDRLDRTAHAEQLERGLADDHHAVRRNAMISLHKLRGDDARNTLLEMTDDESERVREWAAHLLGGVDDDRVREALRTLAEHDDSQVVRETSRSALDDGEVGDTPLGTGDAAEYGGDTLNRQPDL